MSEPDENTQEVPDGVVEEENPEDLTDAEYGEVANGGGGK